MSQLNMISAAKAKEMLDKGEAVLIDIREPDETSREKIKGSELHPLSSFDPAQVKGNKDKVAIYHCAGGKRVIGAQDKICQTDFKALYNMEDGIMGWKSAGFETEKNVKMPISIQRQVQIGAGLTVILGSVLGMLFSPLWIILSIAAGLGLVYAGITEVCFLTIFLKPMPWNKVFFENEDSKAECDSKKSSCCG